MDIGAVDLGYAGFSEPTWGSTDYASTADIIQDALKKEQLVKEITAAQENLRGTPRSARQSAQRPGRRGQTPVRERDIADVHRQLDNADAGSFSMIYNTLYQCAMGSPKSTRLQWWGGSTDKAVNFVGSMREDHTTRRCTSGIHAADNEYQIIS
ncbi:hypothetical protein C8Q72DRAFT_303420 [Fomitopsis betulina]|nr:hypothetical protein C8Q72DRAFT_303420 [Fomitopsis betulina]